MAKPDGSTTLLGFVWDEYATTCHAIVPEYYAVVANENDGKPIVRRQALRLVLANMFVCHGLVGEARENSFEALANFEEGAWEEEESGEIADMRSEMWANNARLRDLQDGNTGLTDAVVAHLGEIGDLQKQIKSQDKVKGEVKGLRTKVTNLGVTITDLKNQLKVEKDKVKDFGKERKRVENDFAKDRKGLEDEIHALEKSEGALEARLAKANDAIASLQSYPPNPPPPMQHAPMMASPMQPMASPMQPMYQHSPMQAQPPMHNSYMSMGGHMQYGGGMHHMSQHYAPF